MEFKLIIKKINNTLSKEEEVVFDNWYNESKKHKAFFDKVKYNYENEINQVDLVKGWQRVFESIDTGKKRKFAYWKYAVAASLILLVVSKFIFDKKVDLNTIPNTNTIVNTITPGTDKAILTLEDGSNIELEKGKEFTNQNLKTNGAEIVYNDAETETEKISYNYLTVPRGGQFYVELSDGTKVWLNSETKLKYPVSFIENAAREIEVVYGEAYFDVSPSTLHNESKFRVANGNYKIEVVGTEFNIKAYTDEDIVATTLVEGKVIIDYKGQNNELNPSQQSVLDRSSQVLSVKEINVYDEISWKEGVFSFNNKSLKEIMVVLSRWYDIEVEFKDKKIESEHFVGVIGKDDNIEDLLTEIKNLEIIKDFKIDDKKIIIE